MIRIVCDTNVFVSAVLSPHGRPAEVLRAVLSEEVRLCVDECILHEYYAVLLRPKFGFTESDVNDLLAFLEEASDMVVASPMKKLVADPFDQMFAEIAVAAHADLLVTGHLRHFKDLASYGVKVVSPTDAVNIFLAL